MTLSELLTALKERSSSPVSGTFSIIWLLSNWQIPVLLIFGYKDNDRVDLLSEYFKNTETTKLIFIPIAVTLLYIPIIMALKLLHLYLDSKFEYWATKRKLNITEQLRQENEYGATLFTMNQYLYSISSSLMDAVLQLRLKSSDAIHLNGNNENVRQSILELYNICDDSITNTSKALEPYKMFHKNELFKMEDHQEKLYKIKLNSIRFKISEIIRIVRA